MSVLRFPSVPRRALLLSLAGLGVVVAASLTVRFLPSGSPYFRNTEDFTAFARRHGLFVHTMQDKSGFTGPRLYVADRPMDLEDLNRLIVPQCGLTPDWKGVAWVSVIHWKNAAGNTQSSLNTFSLDGHWRVWGELAIGGDPDFLDRMDRLYREG
jgi:hypothetical protein